MSRTSFILITMVLALSALGIVMLASTSGVRAENEFGDAYFFVKRQAVWLLLALVAGLVARLIDYHFWGRMMLPLTGLTLLLLVLVFVPPIGGAIKGSSRWIHLGGISFQPSELAKLTVIVGLSFYMARSQRWADTLWKGLAVPMGFLGLFLLLILVEPDFGTTLLIAAVGMLILFMGGSRVGYLLMAGLVGLTGFAYLIMQNPERMRRIMAFRDPEKYAQGEAFQLMQAIYAFISGGILGRGLGQSLQKHYYLPEAHTDFIFAIIGEELGLIATLAVVLLFTALFVCGLSISGKAQDPFGRLMAFGISVMLALQAVINIGVVTGCLPTKGLALPFISFGGSSLVMNYMMVGILLNIDTQTPVRDQKERVPVIKDQLHRL